MMLLLMMMMVMMMNLLKGQILIYIFDRDVKKFCKITDFHIRTQMRK